jgi:MFS family permease
MQDRRANYALAVLTFINLFNYIDRWVVATLLEAIKHELGLSDTQLGVIGSGFIVVYAVTSPIFGTLGDRKKRPPLIAIGVAIWSVATGLAGFARGFASLFITRSTVGIGEAAYGTIAPALLSDQFPYEKRGRVMSVFFAAIPIGSALAYVLGGLALRAFGWRGAFWLVGFPGLLLSLLILFVKDPPRGQNDPQVAGVKGNVYLHLFGNIPYLLIVLGYAAYTFALGGLGYWMPAFLQRARGMSAGEASITFGAIVVVTGFVGTFLGGWLGDALLPRTKQSYLWVSGIATLVAAPLTYVGLTNHTKAVYMTMIVIAEVLIFMSTGPVNTAILNVVSPFERAAAVGLSVLLMHAFGDIPSPPLIGALSDRSSLERAFLVVPAAVLIAGLIWIFAAWRGGRRMAATLLLLVCTFSAIADDRCGTSPQNNADVAAFHEWNSARLQSPLEAHAATQVSYGNAIFVMAPDEKVAAGHHPLDLLGRTLSARRVDDDRFEITNVPLQYREPGPLLKSIFREDNPAYVAYDIQAFSFPFGSTQQKKLYLSAFGGIYFSAPPVPPAKQHASAVSAVVNPIPVIAPLLMAKLSKMSIADIYVREQADAVIVTWRFSSGASSDPVAARFAGDVQAVLHANGDIDFNYKSFIRFLGGAPVITTGTEAFRSDRRPIASTTDAGGDAAGIYDLRSVELNRISDVDLVEIRTTVGQAIDPAQVPGTNDVVMMLMVAITPRSGGGSSYTYFSIKRSGNLVQYPNLSESLYTGTFSGATIRLLMPQEFLPSVPADIEITTRENVGGFLAQRDAASFTNITFAPPAHTLNMDVSAFSATTVAMPVVEAFTVPHLDPYAVWDALKSTYGFTDPEVDAVAMYTSFPTDIDSTGAAAYSTVGNAGANGIGTGASGLPRAPALLHMNTAYIPGPLLHEFGHRWGFNVSAKDGTATVRLSDGTAHPREWLDTTAAFTDGTSTLGGTRWAARGNRMFQRLCGVYGYSWLDLYVMGLARPEEVPPIPDVATPSFVGCTQTVTADAKTWTMQQIIDAMGPRVPAYADSQKRFTVAWVLIEDPALTFPGAAATVRSYAEQFEEDFRNATGARGSIARAFPDQPPRRRSARH